MTSTSGSNSGAILALSDLEDEGTTILQNITEDEFPAAPQRESQISQGLCY
jgi:hypothetical protein